MTPKTPPASPPRKVVSDFAAFGAPKSASVFGTAVATTPFSLAGGRAAFGGMRPGAARSIIDDDDDEEDDNGRQKIGLREDAISLDQVFLFYDTSKYALLNPATPQAKRITMQSAWRSMRA